MMNMTETVKQLLIINILFFIGSYFVPVSYDFLALHYFENEKFKIWQPISSMFMHGSIAHIAFNMFALYSFGSALEYRWGVKKFLFFYISCGLFGSLLYLGVNYYQVHEGLNLLLANGFNKAEVLSIMQEAKYDTHWQTILSENQLSHMVEAFNATAVGASGAIYGLLVAFAMMYPNAELALMFIPVPIKAKYFVPAWILLFDVLYGTIFNGNTGIAHTAHIGGAICGFIMMWYWKKNQFNDKRWN